MTGRGDEGGFTLVELMVVMTIMGIIASAITGVVISQLRLEQDQQAMQSTIDDGRRAIEQMRREVRQARRIYPVGADKIPDGHSGHPDRLRFWIDQNQDGVEDAEESICYVVEELPDGDSGEWRLMRRTHATTAAECAPDATAPGDERLLAATLVDPEPFIEYVPAVSDDPYAPPTRQVEIVLALEVLSNDGPSAVDVDATIRLRNVP